MAMHFDLVDLRLMVHVADANSMTRGAELSFISLPAASTRIKNLEESIGVKLLYRTSQGVTLTLPGQAFVQHARTVLGQIEHLRGDMQDIAFRDDNAKIFHRKYATLLQTRSCNTP